MIKQFCLAVLLMLIAAIRVYGDFSKFESFLENENLWQTTADSFLANPQDQVFFQWLSSKNDTARYPGYRNSPQITLLGKKCWEVVVKFDAGNLAEVAISLYNRGDAGDIDDKTKYLQMFKDISGDIEKWVGEKGVVLSEQWLANGKKLKKKVWVKNNSLAIEMRWSASEHTQVTDPQHPEAIKSKFRAEYIQLIMTPFDLQNDPRKNKASSTSTVTATIDKTASAGDMKNNVKKDADGYVCIANIPMVDQGQKGYCAVATAQRILEYYGADIDQHVIAQVANTTTSGGTNLDEMIEMLKKISFKFGVKVRIHTEFNVQKFIAFVDDYNNAARKQKKKGVTIGHVIDVAEVYRAMDSEILGNVRCDKDKAGMRDFKVDIVKHVDAGIPLVWSVMLGIVPEKPELPQAFGGHMRVILGYNKDKNDIVYSDSWGAGHEKKMMSMEDAWTITTGLYSIDPR